MDLRDIFSFPVTQPFGVPDASYSGHHTGVDLGLPLGTPVPAEGPGTVETVFQDATGGEQVKIKYASGAEGWFAHLMTIFVTPGQRVDPQTEIALSGQSGHVTGPHLHFEERDALGNLIDPMTQGARSLLTGGAQMNGPQGPNDLPPAPASAEPGLPGDTTCTPGFHLETITIGPLRYNRCVPDKGPAQVAGEAVAATTNAIGKSLDDFRTTIGTGARQFAVAGVVIGTIVVLARAGSKRILP